MRLRAKRWILHQGGLVLKRMHLKGALVPRETVLVAHWNRGAYDRSAADPRALFNVLWLSKGLGLDQQAVAVGVSFLV